MFFFDAIFFKVHLQNQESRFGAVSERFRQFKTFYSRENQNFLIIFRILGEIRLFTRDPTGRYFKGAFYFPPILPHAKTVVSPSSEGIRGPYGTLVYHQSVILGTGTVFITVGVSPNNSERFLGLGLFFFL